MTKLLFRPKSIFLLAAFALLLLNSFTTHAGVGLRLAQARPYGNLKFVFKNAPSLELFFVHTNQNDRLRGRIGGGYANFATKLDTFSTYDVDYGYPTTLLPGYFLYTRFDLMYVFMDYSYTIVRVKDFGLNVGLGLTVGLYQQDYERSVTGLVHETASIQDEMGGFRSKIGVDYKLGSHAVLFAEAMNNAIASTSWQSFGHNTIGVGLIYFFGESEPNNYYPRR